MEVTQVQGGDAWAAGHAELTAGLAQLAEREGRLRGLLAGDLDGRRQRDGELQSALHTVQGSLTAIRQEVAELKSYPTTLGRTVARQFDYERVVARVREVVNLVLPIGARVLVVSKGDDELLDLNGRTALHFPQDESGVYAGYHPADSAQAVEQLERLRACGAGYLVLPSTSFWWLGHYIDFGKHLEARYRRVSADRYCMVYDLAEQGGRFRRLLAALARRGAS